MPVTPTYPGVYIEEVPSGVHTIAGVATSVAAYIDCFNRGRLNRPIHLLSLGDFERELGGLRFDSEGSYAIQQFFQNGGTEAWVIRTEFVGGAPNRLTAANALIGDAAAIPATVPPRGALNSIDDVRATVEGAIRSAAPANATLAGATVTVETGDRLRIVPGLGTGALNSLTFAAAGLDTTAADLGLIGGGAVSNVGTYRVGYVGVTVDSQLTGGVAGENGLPPTAAELNGNPLNKTGIFALEDVDLFNILCLPGVAASGFNAGQATAVLAVAETYCEQRRAFLVVDTPFGFQRPSAIQNWLANGGVQRHRNAGLFYPRVLVPDPLDEFRLRSFGASGTMAGLMARIDANRGVWKASAGTEATLTNVQELDYVMSDAENG